MNDIDALKIALCYFIHKVLNERKDQRTPNSLLLYNVDDLEYFRNFLWGHSSWKNLYNNCDTTLDQKLEIF